MKVTLKILLAVAVVLCVHVLQKYYGSDRI